MAENQPQLPAGFQRPGIPGAGNILDPAVRGELREKLHGAVHGPAAQPAEAAPEAKPQEAAPAAAAPPAQPAHRAGPFPHGDVDLRGFAANVPPGPVHPQRRQAGRRFYFLSANEPAAAAPAPPAAPRAPDARKPG